MAHQNVQLLLLLQADNWTTRKKSGKTMLALLSREPSYLALPVALFRCQFQRTSARHTELSTTNSFKANRQLLFKTCIILYTVVLSTNTILAHQQVRQQSSWWHRNRKKDSDAAARGTVSGGSTVQKASGTIERQASGAITRKASGTIVRKECTALANKAAEQVCAIP